MRKATSADTRALGPLSKITEYLRNGGKLEARQAFAFVFGFAGVSADRLPASPCGGFSYACQSRLAHASRASPALSSKTLMASARCRGRSGPKGISRRSSVRFSSGIALLFYVECTVSRQLRAAP